MTDHDETERTAARLRGALNAAADVMVVHEFPEREHVKRSRGWLLPIAAAASVVVIVLAALAVTHLSGSTTTQLGTGGTTQPQRPEFYMTAIYSSGPNALQLQVRRTDDGAVTASVFLPAYEMGWGGELTVAASDRAFFIARYPCTSSKATPLTTFSRIAVTGSGRLSNITPVGKPVKGMVTDLAVSPDGTQMAYNALPGACARGSRFNSAAAASVSIDNLSTGAVRTWQDATRGNIIGGLSWSPDGRTLVIDEDTRGSGGSGLTVYGLDAASTSGALQAHSTVLLHQNGTCSTCVTSAIAGPDGSLTALEYQPAGQPTRVQVVRIPAAPAPGSPQTVLYSELTDQSARMSAEGTGLYADSSGQWLLLWPTSIASTSQGQSVVAKAGWISGGQLHPLPGVGQVFPEGVAW